MRNPNFYRFISKQALIFYICLNSVPHFKARVHKKAGLNPAFLINGTNGVCQLLLWLRGDVRVNFRHIQTAHLRNHLLQLAFAQHARLCE